MSGVGNGSSGVPRALGRLAGRSWAEIGVRGSQSARALMERFGLGVDAAEPSDEAFVRHLRPDVQSANVLDAFRSTRTARFFAGFADMDRVGAVIAGRFAPAAYDIVRRAEAIADGRSTDLGVAGIDYGHPIDWHRDPQVGLSAPRVHWSAVPYLDAATVGDHKTIWEVNRQQYLVDLGQAYCLTRNDRFADTFVAHVQSWADENPPQIGINWASSLEVSFRAMSWLWAMYLFRHAEQLTPAVFTRMLKYLWLHGRHVERYVSTYFSPNTHLTGEALGLFVLGTALPELRAAERWRSLGWRIMEQEAARQIRDDGVYFEQSTWYQRYTVDFYVHAIALAAATGWPVSRFVRNRAQRAAECLMHFTRPDGTTPLIGDDDGGSLTRLDVRAPDDFRATLATAAVVFDHADLKYVARDPSIESLWLVGPDAAARFDALPDGAPAATSTAFPDGGYFVVRDGWSAVANWACVDCGPHGGLPSCGHSHADALGMDVSVGGRTLFVDPGTFTYTGTDRDRFRATRAHNAVVVDGESSSAPAGMFRWATAASSRANAWVSTETFAWFSGEHNGFERLSPPVTHARDVLLIHGCYWLIVDHLTTTGPHTLDVMWHLAPGLTEEASGPSSFEIRGGSREPVARIALVHPRGVATWEHDWVSHRFGERAPARTLRFSVDGRTSETILTVILPVGDPHIPMSFAVQASDSGYVMRGPTESGFTDTILVSAGAGASADGFETDARLAWIRARRDGACDFVVVEGSRLSEQGRVVADRPGATWIAGTRASGRWQIAASVPPEGA